MNNIFSMLKSQVKSSRNWMTWIIILFTICIIKMCPTHRNYMLNYWWWYWIICSGELSFDLKCETVVYNREANLFYFRILEASVMEKIRHKECLIMWCYWIYTIEQETICIENITFNETYNKMYFMTL